MRHGGLGWVRDPERKPGERQDWSAAEIIAETEPPEAHSNRHLIATILNQGMLPTCVTNVAVQAIRACQISRNVPPVLGSRLFAHYIARSTQGAHNALGGINYRTLFDVLDTFGLPAEIHWAYDDSVDGPNPKWQQMPAADAFRMAYDQKVPLQRHRIYEFGDARLTAVRRAVSQGKVVAFGAMVTEAFCENKYGAQIVPPPAVWGDVVGGHAMLIAEYDRESFGGPNSWGKNFGDNGWFKLSPEYIALEYAADFWIVDQAVKFTS
jgi:hypothetical protein